MLYIWTNSRKNSIKILYLASFSRLSVSFSFVYLPILHSLNSTSVKILWLTLTKCECVHSVIQFISFHFNHFIFGFSHEKLKTKLTNLQIHSYTFDLTTDIVCNFISMNFIKNSIKCYATPQMSIIETHLHIYS